MNPDGTTATLSPVVQESEMNHIRSIFDRAANSIIQASELAVQVRALAEQVKALQDDIEYVRSRNKELDAHLSDVRTQRDQAKHELEQVRAELSQTQRSLVTLDSECDSHAREAAELREQLTQAKKDRDDTEYKNMVLTEDLDKASAKLAKVQELFGPEPVKPEPSIPTPPSYSGQVPAYDGEFTKPELSNDPQSGPETWLPPKTW